MSDRTIQQRVHSVVQEVLQLPAEKITTDAKFREDLGADSLDLVTLIMALEDEFKTDIPEGQETSLETVGSAVAYIEKNLPAVVKA